MKLEDCKVGMKVRWVNYYDGKSDSFNFHLNKNSHGTIVDILYSSTPPIGVEWYHNMHSGHSCSYKGKYDYCWYVFPEELSNPVENLKRIIDAI